MAQILSFPFRVATNGTIATVAQGSDQANGEQLAVLVSTIQGECDMAPGFGMPDPAFSSGIIPGVMASQVAMWGPDVTITAVSALQVSETESDVTIGFE
jgi:hypothetical protein